MAPNPYPNLGFNPVEGMPADVEATVDSIAETATVVGDATTLLDRLGDANDEAWRGEAGEAFRAHLDQTLSTDLRMASHALAESLALLRRWHGDLTAMTEHACQLDAEAGAARAALAGAEAELARAGANPDLGLAGAVFDTGEELRAAQQLLDAATGAVRRAQAAVDDRSADLESILRRARELRTDCEANAAGVAEELTAIASRYAPSEPDKDILDRLGDAVDAIKSWYDDNKEDIHQVLSTVSAASGVLAALTPPPIDVLALGVSVVAGAGVLAMDLSDPEIQAGLGQVLRGDFSGESLGALTSVGFDVLGVLPGVGLAKGVKALDGYPDMVAAAANVGRHAAPDVAVPMTRMEVVSQVAGSGGFLANASANGVGKVTEFATQAAVTTNPILRAPLAGLEFAGRHAANDGLADGLKMASDRVVTTYAVHSAAREYER